MFFDKIADSYDKWYETKLGSFVDEVETKLAFDFFQPTKGMKILDVGCGTGNFSIKLAKKGCKVIGVDISDAMLEIARKKAKSNNLNITFYNMNVYDLDFDDETFDAIFSMAAFEFIKEPEKAFKEMMRVLKPGGQLLIGTIHKDSHWGRLYLKQACKPDSIFRFANFKTLKELEDLDRKNLIKSGECLFIPPDIREDEISWEKERELSQSERGGFICALWKKTE
ncbi:ubiquinone biosynthesis methyltransferase UbiE [Anoxybacter fermentans]|uniref:Ubiquinone biosynthesis methyltransferase UbiE n=1 Tax=Anoxybacter fermentans TaxID=1323375 RepID=A0A3S9SYJ7_9FIRM|nr:class I SAM-dependent methyltransferase [Anoxybacter fermentans]AZR73334.1 ubiquinone biosynthesis methyltransferase UbiE [Anoxybacter fermentans]